MPGTDCAAGVYGSGAPGVRRSRPVLTTIRPRVARSPDGDFSLAGNGRVSAVTLITAGGGFAGNCQVHVEEALFSISLFSRNEPGNAGLHYTGLYSGIKPDSRLDSIARLPHRLARKCGNVKVLLDAAGVLRGRQGGRPALDRPGEQDRRRGFVAPPDNREDDRIYQQIGLAGLGQGRVRVSSGKRRSQATLPATSVLFRQK